MINQTFGKSLGDVIRDARVAREFTLRTLADRIGKTPSYLSDIENARRVPAEDVLRALADVLGLDFDDLMARAGRLGDQAERYLKRTPAAGVLFRRLSEANATPQQIEELLRKLDRDREGGS